MPFYVQIQALLTPTWGMRFRYWLRGLFAQLRGFFEGRITAALKRDFASAGSPLPPAELYYGSMEEGVGEYDVLYTLKGVALACVVIGGLWLALVLFC